MNDFTAQFYSAIPEEDKDLYISKGITFVDDSNKTALHVYLKTTKQRNPDLVKYLISEGCLINNIWDLPSNPIRW